MLNNANVIPSKLMIQRWIKINDNSDNKHTNQDKSL